MSSRNEAEPGQIDDVKILWSHDDAARERQDFLAGTVWAAAAGVVLAEDIDPLFLVLVGEDDRTDLPAPQIHRAFDLLDAVGSLHASAQLAIEPSWAVLLGDPEESLVKLTLTFNGPETGTAAIVMATEKYAGLWRHIADGGVVGLSTKRRVAALQQPGAQISPTDVCVLIRTHQSPGLRTLIDRHDWPRDPRLD